MPIKSQDVTKFTKSLKTYVKTIEENIEEALWVCIRQIEGTSQDLVPIKTGALYDSFFGRIEFTGNTIKAVYGYDEDGSLSHYAKIMHEGYWPNDFWTGDQAYLNGTAINYHDTYQPTPESEFLDKGFLRNRQKIEQILQRIFDV